MAGELVYHHCGSQLAAAFEPDFFENGDGQNLAAGIFGNFDIVTYQYVGSDPDRSEVQTKDGRPALVEKSSFAF